QVEESRISDIATTPLLLTMAALLFEDRGGDRLPPSRAQLYDRFVDMLLTDEEGNRQTRDSFVRPWRRRHGQAGATCAAGLFEQRGWLLRALARWQLDNELADEKVTFAQHLADRLLVDGDVPANVGADWLAEQLTTLLGRTGVVVERFEEL